MTASGTDNRKCHKHIEIQEASIRLNRNIEHLEHFIDKLEGKEIPETNSKPESLSQASFLEILDSLPKDFCSKSERLVGLIGRLDSLLY